ncbi:helix-turn-helix domain-containing protein [Anaplasma marginale]|uniref:helix-turn-helix domain-containing protein n=1 Tax=Anaplasma marginale TaxID=770 RepID=UPI0009B64F2A
MEIVQVSRNTIYNWFNAWDKNGLVGLYDSKGRGRNQKLNIKYQQKIKQWVIRIKK